MEAQECSVKRVLHKLRHPPLAQARPVMGQPSRHQETFLVPSQLVHSSVPPPRHPTPYTTATASATGGGLFGGPTSTTTSGGLFGGNRPLSSFGNTNNPAPSTGGTTTTTRNRDPCSCLCLWRRKVARCTKIRGEQGWSKTR